MGKNKTRLISVFLVLFMITSVGASMCIGKTGNAISPEPSITIEIIPQETTSSSLDEPEIQEKDDYDIINDDGAMKPSEDEDVIEDDIVPEKETEQNKEENVEVTVPHETEEKEEVIEDFVYETEPVQPEPLKLTGGYASIDRSGYTPEEIKLLDTILAKIKENLNTDIKEEKIPLDATFDFSSYYRVASYFYVYYGQERAVDYTFDLVNAMRDDGYLLLKYDEIREFERVRQANQAKIDSILLTFTDGDERHILKQISEYIRNHITYTYDYYDLSDALNGRCVCNGYALLFNAMANRAGIKSDMCVGKANNGENHAWNRVTLEDGSYRFYDITFYDSNGNSKYLHAKNSFHGQYRINDYSIGLY